MIGISKHFQILYRFSHQHRNFSIVFLLPLFLTYIVLQLKILKRILTIKEMGLGKIRELQSCLLNISVNLYLIKPLFFLNAISWGLYQASYIRNFTLVIICNIKKYLQVITNFYALFFKRESSFFILLLCFVSRFYLASFLCCTIALSINF